MYYLFFFTVVMKLAGLGKKLLNILSLEMGPEETNTKQLLLAFPKLEGGGYELCPNSTSYQFYP